MDGCSLTAAKLTINTNRRDLKHNEAHTKHMPRVKRRPADGPAKMPKGFYLKSGTWYKRILKPDPRTGAWTLQAESTHCKEDQRQAAIDYVARRTAELDKSARLGKTVDPGRITVNELFDDLLASVPHEPTRRN